MKNYILLTICIIFLNSCENSSSVKIDNAEWSGTISASDERNTIMNSFADAYANQDNEKALSIFADDAVFHVNDTELTPEDVVNAFATGHEYFDDIKHVESNTTTMFYNNGEIYTNYWYTWNGTNKKTGELLELRGYAWFKWDGLKVVEAYNAFDPTEYNKAFVE